MTFARLLGTAALCVAPLAGAAQNLSEDDVRALVLETIRENPVIIVEALQMLEQQQQEAQAEAARATLSDQRDLLENDSNAPVIGNPDGDVTIVEFFDYNCPYCRNAKTEIDALLAADANVRVVMREWPVLGEGSVFAARAALASREQGMYEAFHNAMMTMEGRAEEQSVMRVAASVGLDVDQLRRDMDAPEITEHLQTSTGLSRALGFTGTPSFVIGDNLAPGMIAADQMATLVDLAREGSD
ncbi:MULTISPECIES: DsbA family protein [unclassified Yoonia]|uniref:DsbA family protein n=1 Tax=unclassified Yoonia TaxID=2629118 RepID=UPI002AFFAB8A|nr:MULTISPECIES: DsbA family protein [unclassified Yoonia]